jgi:tetratricopeptide (TPR) repeat protein
MLSGQNWVKYVLKIANYLAYISRLLAAIAMFLVINVSIAVYHPYILSYISLTAILSAYFYYKMRRSKLIIFIMLLVAFVYNPIEPFNFTNVFGLYASILFAGIFIGTWYYQPTPDSKYEDPAIDILNLDLEKAEKKYQTMNQKKPNNPVIGNNLGVIAFMQNKFGQAEQFFEEAVKKDNKYHYGYYNLALTYQYTGQNTLSLKTLSRAIEAEPTFAKTYYYLKSMANKEELSLVYYQRPYKESSVVIIDPDCCLKAGKIYEQVVGKPLP